MRKEIAVKNFREGITTFEEKMKATPGSLGPDDYETKHEFADGLYLRQILVPKGHLFVTRLHKKSHPLFIMQGDISILTEEGVVRVKAPYHTITKAGTKRVVYVHEDVIGLTVHATNLTDPEEIVKEVTSEDFTEFDQYLEGKEASKLLAIMGEK